MAHAMPEPHQRESIFRTLLFPQEANLVFGNLGTFRLRYALAEDGCSESQVAVAKLLLSNLSSRSEERNFNAQLAVYWLFQAAKKGQDEAFLLLKQCFDSDIGVNVINKSEIEQCLRFSEEEKRARKISFSIIRAIMSDTEEILSGDIFRENIDLIFKENQEKGEGDGIWNLPRQKSPHLMKTGDSPPQKKLDASPLSTKSDDSPPQKKLDASPLSTKSNDSPPQKKLDASPLSTKSDDSPPQKKYNASPQKRKADDSLPQSKSDENILLKQPLIQLKAEDTSAQNRVSFNKVVSSVQSCLEGNVPLVSLTQMSQFDEHKRWLTTKYFCKMWDIILRSAERLIQSISSLVIVLSMLFLCMLLQTVDYLSSPGSATSNFVKKLNIFAVTLLCLLTMMSCTCYVLQVNFGTDNFKKWLSLIKIFDSNVRSAEVERKYVSKTTFPLVIFLIVSFVYVALVPLSITPLTLPDIGVLSFIFMLLIDRTIYQQRYYVNISLILNALTCLYTVNVQNIFTNSLSYFNFTITYEISSNFHLHISALSCLTLPFILPYLYVKMARGQQRGWHLVLLPHLMSLTWMNLASIHLADATSTQLFYSSLTLFVVLFVAKYIGISFTLVLYLLFKGADHFGTQILLLCIAFIIIYFTSLFFVVKFKISYDSRFWSLFICISILILSYQAAKPGDLNEDDSNRIFPWEKYQTCCYNQAWYRSTTAEIQISCLPLKGKKVAMEGTITDIDVVEVSNKMELIANYLPQVLQSWFVCGLGNSFAGCNSEGMTAIQRERCEIYETVNSHQCHLRNWDEYQYRILMEVNTRSSPEVALYTHGSSEFVKNLKEGDSLQVIGSLESNIGKPTPGFYLKYAKCTNCYSDVVYKTSYTLPKQSYGISLKNLVQLYFAPILQYNFK